MTKPPIPPVDRCAVCLADMPVGRLMCDTCWDRVPVSMQADIALQARKFHRAFAVEDPAAHSLRAEYETLVEEALAISRYAAELERRERLKLVSNEEAHRRLSGPGET